MARVRTVANFGPHSRHAHALRSIYPYAAPWLPLVLLAAGWEAVARSGMFSRYVLPPLSVVLRRIVQDSNDGDLFVALGLTLSRALCGFLIAGFLGVVVGLLMYRSRVFRWLFDPIVSIGFPMPKVAFLPIIVLWLGFHDLAKISMIVFDAIFPVITATVAALSGVDRHYVWSASSLGAGRHRMLWEILLPAASPQILTGLQVALPIALILAVFTEMMTGGIGLGANMMQSGREADSVGVFAGLIEIAVVGYVVVRALALIRRRLLIWHPEGSERVVQ